jgi:hypothetical protein
VGARPQLVEMCAFGPGVIDVAELGERRALPPLEQVDDVSVVGTVRDLAREAIEVDGDAVGIESVAVVDGIDRQARDRATKPRHVVLERGGRVGRAIGRPQRVDRRVDRYRPTPAQHQQREQPPLQRAGRRDVTAGVVEHPQRAEHVDPHRRHHRRSPVVDTAPTYAAPRAAVGSVSPPTSSTTSAVTQSARTPPIWVRCVPSDRSGCTG